MTKPRPKRGPGNPVDSPWYSTPKSARKRKPVELTLPPETIAILETLAMNYGLSKSAMVERLILADAKQPISAENPATRFSALERLLPAEHSAPTEKDDSATGVTKKT